jgi:hypothetical protein
VSDDNKEGAMRSWQKIALAAGVVLAAVGAGALDAMVWASSVSRSTWRANSYFARDRISRSPRVIQKLPVVASAAGSA